MNTPSTGTAHESDKKVFFFCNLKKERDSFDSWSGLTGGLGHENRVNRGSDLNEVQCDCEQRRCHAQEVAGLFW